ncbi:MAG: methyltransferase domain-containing protein [Candidatus Omnitrophota bacterium]
MQNQYELDIYALAYGGKGIGMLDGMVCFVEGALPGEKVRFIKQSEKKKFINGRVREIITASPDRAEPICSHYGRCGGCQYQHLKYEKEVFYKAEQAQSILSRIGGFKEYDFQGITPSTSQYNYRSSITLHRSSSAYGYFAKDNRTIIPIEQCPLAREEINSAIPTLFAKSKKDNVTMKCDKSGNVYIGGYPGHRFYKEDFLETELTFSPLAFTQPNREIASAIVETLRAWIGKEDREVLFDLYCGAGFFGILLRDMFKTVIGIDESGVATDCAKTSKKALGAGNVTFYQGDADDRTPVYYEKLRGKVNTILIDPPRTGISGELAAYLAGLKDASSLYYISCDPAILARDARILTRDGAWKLERVASFDMFPRTKHVESIALFKRPIS